MRRSNWASAAALAMVAAGSALAGWGVRYEVNDGTGWTNSLSLNLSREPQALDFRITVFHEGVTMVETNTGAHVPAIAPLRLCNSQKITNFGAAGSGDQVVSFVSNLSSVNAAALVTSQAGANRILGTPNSSLSFTSDLSYAFSLPHAPRSETQFYSGKIVIGNSTPESRERTITFGANTFAYPNAILMFGGPNGGAFLVSTDTIAFGIALEPATTIPVTITVHTPHCASDMNNDGFVIDEDFVIFVAAFSILECDAPSMPAGCPADLNGDGTVDDTDFVIFAAAYDELICP